MARTTRDQIRDICLASKSWNKCFGIGANKTGTSTLDYLIRNILGLRANQIDIVGESAIQATRGNYAPFAKQMDLVDFHQDLPLSTGNFYVAADAIFPRSKFILTTRCPEDWARSFINFYSCSILTIIRDDWEYNHSRGRYPNFCASWINFHYSRALAVLKRSISTKSAVTMKDEQLIELIHSDIDFIHALCGLFQARNCEIMHYFSRRPNDFIEVDWGRTTSLKPLLEFLEIPDILQTHNIPIINSSSKVNPKEEVLSPNFYSSEFIRLLKTGNFKSHPNP
jgi:hypothetical protein